MVRSKYIFGLTGSMVASTLLAIVVIPPASAATQNITYNCMNSTRNITLNVNPGDVLNITSNCGAIFLQAVDARVISSNSGTGQPSRSFVVSASLAPGTYTDAFEVYTAVHNFYQLVYAPAITVSAAEIAAASAAAEAAKREAEKQSARAEIVARYKGSKLVEADLFSKAEIAGISNANINQINAEVLGFSEETRSNLAVILKVARKYEVVGTISSDRVNRVYSNLYIEIGLISAESKNKVELVSAVRRMNPEDRSTYGAIKSAIEAAMNRIQMRNDRLASILARISGKNGK
jgi:hypothetical protein